MSKKFHSMHETIGDILERSLPGDCTLVEDIACGGTQRIPLFCTAKKSRETEYCNVDLLVLKDNRIKAIVEIEESNVKPTQICGKFLTSALAKYYIHDSKGNRPVEMSNAVIFIQIVDTSNLVKDRTSKFKQWRLLEESINSIIPLKNSRIVSYRLLSTDEIDKLALLTKEIT